MSWEITRRNFPSKRVQLLVKEGPNPCYHDYNVVSRSLENLKNCLEFDKKLKYVNDESDILKNYGSILTRPNYEEFREYSELSLDLLENIQNNNARIQDRLNKLIAKTEEVIDARKKYMIQLNNNQLKFGLSGELKKKFNIGQLPPIPDRDPEVPEEEDPYQMVRAILNQPITPVPEFQSHPKISEGGKKYTKKYIKKQSKKSAKRVNRKRRVTRKLKGVK